MKTFLRILRALAIRLVFMGYSLLCIWRVTFVSDNKYYWLMMMSVGLLLIETAILLWLRAGKEFRGILPSVLFFLSCVVPSIWILCLDEASRKNKFGLVAGNQESKIKSFVLSLDDIVSAPKTDINNDVTVANLVNTSSLKITRSLREIAEIAMPLIEKDDTTNAELISSTPSSKPKSKSKVSLAEAKKFLQKNVECCDVKISYWFQEDNLQHLFLQSLMIILITSRWLITRGELNLNQRGLILVISISVSADICDFFNYLNLEIVYSNPYIIYAILVIISLSLIQFIFLHVEDSLNLTRSFSSSFNSSTTSNNESDTNSSTNGSGSGNTNEFGDTDDILNKKYTKNNKKKQTLKDNKKSNKIKKKRNSNPAKIIQKHYNFLKNHLKADPTIAIRNGTFGAPGTRNNLINMKHAYYDSKTHIGEMGGDTGGTTVGQAAIINSFPLARNKFTKYICNIFCCCIENKDPLFFILLAGLLLHDGSYLGFRIFIMCKLGWENTLSLNPLLIFFMAKNIFIILTQIYKVYTVTNERRQLKYLENYRGLVMGTQQQQHTQQQTQNQHKYQHQIGENNFFENNHYSQQPINFNQNRKTNNFLTTHNAAIAAAATGGQIPLINQQYEQYPKNFVQHNAYMYQPPVTNPYRFAQLYGDATTNPNTPNNFNRSCSTLGESNNGFYAGDLNPHASPLNRYTINNRHFNKTNTLPHGLNDTSLSSTLPANYNQTYQSQSFYQNPPRGGSSLNSPLPDSLLAIMNNENQNYYTYKKQQQYDQNITMCKTPENNMTTPLNPFSAKMGKALYGLPFLGRSKSSLSYGMANGSDYYSEQPNLYKNSYQSNQNSNKMMKASKI